MNTGSPGLVITTGASSGIVCVYANRLARRGYDLLLALLNSECMAELANRVGADTRHKFEIMVADLENCKDVAGLERILSDAPGIGLLAKILRALVVAVICTSSLAAPPKSRAAELREETLNTWDAYVKSANLRMGSQAPLWVEQSPDRLYRVHAGEILVSSVGQQNPKPVPSGLIHDWVGAALIPDARLSNVLSAVRDYSNYKQFYKPTIVGSKALGTDGSCDKYSVRVVNKEAVAEIALDMEYETCYYQTDARRWYSITHTTRVREIRNYGRPNELELPPDEGTGYIWRLYSIAKYEEKVGGTYVEVEAIALSRDIPVALRWIVDPIVRHVSRNSLLISLQQTEEAVRFTKLATGKPKLSIVADDRSQSAEKSNLALTRSLLSLKKP